MDEFMMRPTDVFRSYMAARGFDREATDSLLKYGRIAMAMELMTVARIIEEYSLLPTKEDTIAVIQTLITDQDLFEEADEWYSLLSEWRRIKIESSYEVPDVRASVHGVLRDAATPHDSNGAQPGTDQTMDPPSAS